MSKYIQQGNIKHIPAHFDDTPSKPVSIENLGGLAVAESICNKAPVEATHVHWHKNWIETNDQPQHYKHFDSKWYRLGNLGWYISIDHFHDDAWHRKALIKLDDIRAAIKIDPLDLMLIQHDEIRDKIMSELKQRYPKNATAKFYIRTGQKNVSIGRITSHHFTQGTGTVIGYVGIRMESGSLRFIHHSDIKEVSQP